MTMNDNRSMKRGLHLAALVLGAAALAGCASGGFADDDTYTGSTHSERYPIRVAKAPMKLEVATTKNGLKASQIEAISRFAQSAKMASVSDVALRRPSGGGASAAVARQTFNLLVQQGVDPSRITQSTYRGTGNSPVLISFTRSVAVTKECGNWSTDLANTPDNQPHENFGCAVQQNTAAMIQNPSDIEIPRKVDTGYANIDYKKIFIKLD